jgi:hypothetical protein
LSRFQETSGLVHPLGTCCVEMLYLGVDFLVKTSLRGTMINGASFVLLLSLPMRLPISLQVEEFACISLTSTDGLRQQYFLKISAILGRGVLTSQHIAEGNVESVDFAHSVWRMMLSGRNDGVVGAAALFVLHDMILDDIVRCIPM